MCGKYRWKMMTKARLPLVLKRRVGLLCCARLFKHF